jgi:hypothetical protein
LFFALFSLCCRSHTDIASIYHRSHSRPRQPQ